MRQNIDSKRSIILILILSIILLAISTLFAQTNVSNNKLPQFFEFRLLSQVWIGAIFCLIGLVRLYKTQLKHNLRFLFLFIIFFVFAIFPALPLEKCM